MNTKNFTTSNFNSIKKLAESKDVAKALANLTKYSSLVEEAKEEIDFVNNKIRKQLEKAGITIPENTNCLYQVILETSDGKSKFESRLGAIEEYMLNEDKELYLFIKNKYNEQCLAAKKRMAERQSSSNNESSIEF